MRLQVRERDHWAPGQEAAHRPHQRTGHQRARPPRAGALRARHHQGQEGGLPTTLLVCSGRFTLESSFVKIKL